MSEIPQELSYTPEHEWLRREEGSMVTVGITDHAQDLLGDVVFVELPEVGKHFATGDACAVVESVKAASDVYAPLSGEVSAVNERLTQAPENVNQDPYGAGWLFQLRVDPDQSSEGLLDAAAYETQVTTE
ncbi:MAG TPA: glycine cleavage system protein GcvH [Gammaproteobacteria bacterium]|nr:glycine cleavage system protein GcvH [Gammaproteobacteria bacterium]